MLLPLYGPDSMMPSAVEAKLLEAAPGSERFRAPGLPGWESYKQKLLYTNIISGKNKLRWKKKQFCTTHTLTAHLWKNNALYMNNNSLIN